MSSGVDWCNESYLPALFRLVTAGNAFLYWCGFRALVPVSVPVMGVGKLVKTSGVFFPLWQPVGKFTVNDYGYVRLGHVTLFRIRHRKLRRVP